MRKGSKARRRQRRPGDKELAIGISDDDNYQIQLRPYAQESLLIDALPEMTGRRILCTSLGLAQFGRTAAQNDANVELHCTYLDQYRAEMALSTPGPLPANLAIVCEPDLADGDADVIALPLSATGEAELTRDLLQSGHGRLRIGGKMFAATNNCRDTWLQEQLQQLFRRVERRDYPTGVLYVAVKMEPLKKVKDFGCEFAFRDRGRLLKAYSRPGVFAHRRIDLGARRLIDVMQITTGMRVLDLGCGSGVVALAAACRAADVMVHAVDSNSRAVQCTQRGAELNGLANISSELNCRGTIVHAGEYDLVLTNPPYYSSFEIARRLLMAGREALRVGGSVLVVTKFPRWYEQNMPRWFNLVSTVERKSYHLFQGMKANR